MDDWLSRADKLTPKSKVAFTCSRCGQCCRNVKQSVCVEPLDAFRITKYLRDTGHEIEDISEFLAAYAEPVLLDECGYPAIMLKVKEPNDSCIFLDGNRCTIHSSNPRACRTYPFVAGPGDNGELVYLLSREKPHHYHGKSIQTKTWFKQRISDEDREFIQLEFSNVVEIAKLLRQTEDKVAAAMLFVGYKYIFYDLDQPFLPQYKENHRILISELSKLKK